MIGLDFNQMPIKRKLTLVILAVSLSTVLLLTTGLLVFQWFNARQLITRDLMAQAKIIAANSTAALSFGDKAAADETLRSLQANPRILQASLYLPDGTMFATFDNLRAPVLHRALPATEGVEFRESYLILCLPVTLEQKQIGNLSLCFDFRAMQRDFVRPYLMILCGSLFLSVLLTLALSERLQRVISVPIHQLADTARAIAERKDYSVRATVRRQDELGTLTEAFNHMLARIEEQDQVLQQRMRVDQLITTLSTDFINLTADEIDHAITMGLQQIGEFLQVPSVRLYTLSVTGEHFLNTHTWCQDAPAAGPIEDTEIPVTSMPWWVQQLNRGEVIELADIASMPPEGATERRQFETAGTRAVLAVGIGFSDRLTGFLCARVHDRPRDWADHEVVLFKLASEIFTNALERKRVSEAMEGLNRRLVETSRHAGMAEVATGVLHNVGNVLNSVNVSSDLIRDRLRNLLGERLGRLANLIQQHKDDLSSFLTNDPKGRLVPDYLANLVSHLDQERKEAMSELEQLCGNVEHIKQIVAMQQSYARASGVYEDLPLALLVDDALRMNSGAFQRHGVTVQRDYQNVPLVRVDKHKVLQILVNLFRNAKYALDDAGRSEKLLSVTVTSPEPQLVCVIVCDNGIGISAENLTRVFQHGFTTRSAGHGFGLHSGALAASEMGGRLYATSDGVGCGATFTLELPAAPRTETSAAESGPGRA